MLVARSARKQFQQDRAEEYLRYIYDSVLPSNVTYRVGDIIHLKTKNGTYRIINVYKDMVTITCQTWILQHGSGFRTTSNAKIRMSEIRCKYGQGLSRMSINSVEKRK